MAKKPVPSQIVKTPDLAFVGFGLGIVAIIPMVIMTVDFIIPQAFAAAVAKMPSGGQSALLYFCMFGSLPCAIASLVIGLLALRQIRREKFLTGKKWAVCAITLGGLGLVFGVFLLIHFITLLQLTPPVPT